MIKEKSNSLNISQIITWNNNLHKLFNVYYQYFELIFPSVITSVCLPKRSKIALVLGIRKEDIK